MRRLATAVSCLALVALTACSESEASPPPEPEDWVGATSDSANASSTPDDASQTSPGPTDTRGEDPGVPELPPEAMEDTEDGAEAFVQYYIDLINYTGQFPQSGLLERYGESECATCDVLEAETTELENAANHYKIDSITADTIRALPFESGYRAQLRGKVFESAILGETGDVVARTEAVPDLAWAFQLNFESDRFTIQWIKSVES